MDGLAGGPGRKEHQPEILLLSEVLMTSCLLATLARYVVLARASALLTQVLHRNTRSTYADDYNTDVRNVFCCIVC